jgi:hypothetical protein
VNPAATIAVAFAALRATTKVRERATDIGLTNDELNRFLGYISTGKSSACWPWTGSRNVAGYGRIGLGGRTHRAHRLAFQLFKGSISPDLHVDHGCHNRDLSCRGGSSCHHRTCCNPAHLFAATLAQNVLNSHSSPAARNAMKTHCNRGHEFNSRNTQVDASGRRRCRTCAGLTGRGQGHQALKVHCPKGHPYDEANTYRSPKGDRTCRTCRREKARADYHRSKAVVNQ